MDTSRRPSTIRAAEQTANEQVDDGEDHSAMIPTRLAALARSSNRAPQDRLGLGAQELRPGWPGPPRARGQCRRSSGSPMPSTPLPSLRGRRARRESGGSPIRGCRAPAGGPDQRPVVAGRPVLPRLDRAAQRRRRMLRCQRRIVSGVTRSRSPRRRALGIALSRVASRARSAQCRFGRRGCCRCRTASWWRRIKISAVFHVSSRRDSRSQEATRVIRRKTNRRHMIGHHDGRTARGATLLIRAVDGILGTHRIKVGLTWPLARPSWWIPALPCAAVERRIPRCVVRRVDDIRDLRCDPAQHHLEPLAQGHL